VWAFARETVLLERLRQRQLRRREQRRVVDQAREERGFERARHRSHLRKIGKGLTRS
jgi:hypothetical protein